MALLRGEPSAGEWTAFSEDVWIGPSRFAIRTPDYKLVVQGADLPERFLDNKMKMTIRESVTRLEPEQLFHLPQDAQERENLLARDPARAAQLRSRLLAHRNSLIPPHRAETGRIAVEGESLERLRALGYVE
jgi:hypothetical protein